MKLSPHEFFSTVISGDAGDKYQVWLRCGIPLGLCGGNCADVDALKHFKSQLYRPVKWVGGLSFMTGAWCRGRWREAFYDHW